MYFARSDSLCEFSSISNNQINPLMYTVINQLWQSVGGLCREHCIAMRGGARNHKKPELDESILMDIFDKYTEELVNTGTYEFISKTQATCAAGLAFNFNILRALLAASPSAEIPTGLAKHAMIKVLTAKPSLNKSIYSTSTFAGLRVDRLSTMLYHLRRTKTDKQKQVAVASKCTGPEWNKVTQLFQMMDSVGSEDQQDDVTVFVPERQEAEEALQEEQLQAPQPSQPPSLGVKRKLKVEISVDSQGLPAMFEGKACKRASSAKIEVDSEGYPVVSSVTSSGSSTLQAMVYRSAPVPVAKAKAHAKGKAKAKAKAGAAIPVVSGENGKKDWGTMFYKATGSFAIRRKWGKKEQVFQFKCPKGNKLNQEAKGKLEILAKKCLVRLLEGEMESEVGAWAQSQARLIC